MIRRMTLVFLGALSASTAQAQDCSQCQPQASQCQQQAYNAQQSCLAPYSQTRTICRSEAEAYRRDCWQTCTVYCNYCDSQADGMIQQCEIQYNGEAAYCQSGYDASMNICYQNYTTCMANCSNDLAYLSPVSGVGGASLWNAPPTASAACVNVSAVSARPTITKPIAELWPPARDRGRSSSPW